LVYTQIFHPRITASFSKGARQQTGRLISGAVLTDQGDDPSSWLENERADRPCPVQEHAHCCGGQFHIGNIFSITCSTEKNKRRLDTAWDESFKINFCILALKMGDEFATFPDTKPASERIGVLKIGCVQRIRFLPFFAKVTSENWLKVAQKTATFDTISRPS
jgi:hypothetical protein